MTPEEQNVIEQARRLVRNWIKQGMPKNFGPRRQALLNAVQRMEDAEKYAA